MKCKQTSDYYFVAQLILLMLASLLLLQPVNAASVSKLYEASIKADADKSEQQLIAEAFTRVLIKVSGRSDVTSSPAYNAMLKKAGGAISQFRYDHRSKEPVSTTETPADNPETIPAEDADQAEEKPEEKEKWFWVRFNSNIVNNLLKSAQIPIWGKIRPETLLWFSQEIKAKRYLQGQYDEPEIYTILKQQAEQRGIVLIFPFLDLEDQAKLSAADIWGNFNDAVLLASRRYQAQSTLTTKLFKEPSGLWVSQWNWLILGEVQSWEFRSEQQDKVLTAGIDELADRLSRQFTQVMRGAESAVILQVNNVGGFRDFQTLDDYLRNLATVKSVDLMLVEQDKVIYTISYLGSKDSLVQEIRLGDVLNTVERSGIDNAQGSENSTYQPVILDDLNDKNRLREKPASEREKALNALDNSGTTAQQAATQISAENSPEKMPEKIIPELEYWLAR